VIKSRGGFKRKYILCTLEEEKRQATDPYQSNEIQIIIPTVVQLTQTGAWGGRVARKRLPKKAAVFGLEKLVNKPRRKVEKLLGDNCSTAKQLEDEEKAEQIVFRPRNIKYSPPIKRILS
jgi:hypothetical protein